MKLNFEANEMKSPIKRITRWLAGDERRTLYAIVLVALLVRVGFVLMLNPNKFYFSDTRHYDGAATHLLAGEGFGEKYSRAPGYPVFMAGVYAIFGHSFVSMRLVEALLGAVLCLLIFVIARRIFGARVALVAAAIAAIFPHFILLVGILYSTNTFTFLMALTVLVLLKTDESGSLWLAALAGGLAGLTALTIPALFFILPFWLLWLLFKPGSSFLRRLATVSLFMVIFALTLVPWTVRNYHVYGRLTLVRPVANTVLPDLDNLEAQEQKIKSGYRSTTEYWKQHPHGTDKDKISNMILHYVKNPVGTIRYVVRELGHFWALYPDRLDTMNPEYRKKIKQEDARMEVADSPLWAWVKTGSILVMTPIFALALVGLFRENPLSRKRLLLLLTISGLSLGYSMLLAEVRYRIPIEPYVLMFTASGLVFLWHKWVRREHANIPPSVGKDRMKIKTPQSASAIES